MSFKELFDKSVDFIDNNRKRIATISLSMLGIMLLIIVFFASSDELSVSKESTQLLNNIEQRKYTVALDYYQSLEKNFSQSKMKRFNKAISKKINKLLLNSGDMYVNGQITKEHYTGLISTINSLNSISLDLNKIIDQSERIREMYKEENLNYDLALSYLNAVSSLNGVDNELDVYKQDIKVLNDSREVYETANKNYQIKKYYEAIQCYDKVLEEDKKYYNLAQRAKDECIETMYDYYIEKSKEENDSGDYEGAIQYIDYLKPYYSEDEEILKLEKGYQENLAMYTLTSDDIINLISKKSEKNKENLSINSLQQMINGNKYYYVELFEYDKLVNEILVDAKTRKIYSYKGSNKNYNCEYSDGYFRILKNGDFQFAISEGEAKFLLENKLSEKSDSYKSIEIVKRTKVDKYVDEKEKFEDLIKKNPNIYYYFIVNKGWFKKKEVCIIDMYSKNIYSVFEDGIKSY